MKMKAKKAMRILKKIFKEIFLISLNVFGLLLLLVLAGFVYLMAITPLGDSLETRHIPQTSIIYDRSGEHVLYEMHGEENRKLLTHDEIPDTVRIATIATEDASFYKHHGIDFVSILRALKKDIETRSASQGASTITQQLARSVYLNRDKTIQRKILEAIYAIKIDKKYSKDQILDAYLNQVPYGSNAYGVETASENYFGKPAKNLSLDEAAFLAAITKAPTYYSPYGDHLDALVNRQKEILKIIADLKLSSTNSVIAALKTDTPSKIKPFVQPIEAPHFVMYVKDYLEKTYGQQLVDEGGLKIYTTLDYDKQKLAEQIVENSQPILAQYGASNAALVAVDPANGQILTMVGSLGYFNTLIDGQVNVTTSPRQPGSSFKPFVYAKAFEDGYQPETLVLDAPTNFGPDGSGKNYIPKNYDGKNHGVLSMRQALAMSLNIPAIKTLRAVGIDSAIEMAHRLGITTLNDRQRYGLSLVIGGGEVTLLDETAGFSVFANDGKRNPIDPILKIVDNRGNIIRENQPQNLPVLDPQVARKIDSILSDNDARSAIFGPNNKLFIPGKTVAAKTGTTQEFRDAWTVGFTPYLAVGVWAGNNDNRPMRAGADGSFVAAPIWNSFMTQATQSYPDIAFAPYEKGDLKDIPRVAGAYQQLKATYYKIANGKKISEKKAEKMDPAKVRTEYETITYEEGQAPKDNRPVF
jgi:penicillin-binding protein 1C